MRNPTSFSLLFFCLLSLLAFCGSSGHNLIDDTCKTCSQEDPNVDFNFCTTSLQAAAINQPLTVYALGNISIGLLQCNATDTRSRAKHLFDKELDPNVKKRLADCFDLYDNALPSIKQAMDLYKSKQFYEANFKVTSAMDAATGCEDGFRMMGRDFPEFTERNSNTFELGAIVLSIMHMLQLG